MIDIDETIKRLYKNPYDNEARPKYRCTQCGEGIYYSEDYYMLDGKTYCMGCVEPKCCE